MTSLQDGQDGPLAPDVGLVAPDSWSLDRERQGVAFTPQGSHGLRLSGMPGFGAVWTSGLR